MVSIYLPQTRLTFPALTAFISGTDINVRMSTQGKEQSFDSLTPSMKSTISEALEIAFCTGYEKTHYGAYDVTKTAALPANRTYYWLLFPRSLNSGMTSHCQSHINERVQERLSENEAYRKVFSPCLPICAYFSRCSKLLECAGLLQRRMLLLKPLQHVG